MNPREIEILKKYYTETIIKEMNQFCNMIESMKSTRVKQLGGLVASLSDELLVKYQEESMDKVFIYVAIKEMLKRAIERGIKKG